MVPPTGQDDDRQRQAQPEFPRRGARAPGQSDHPPTPAVAVLRGGRWLFCVQPPAAGVPAAGNGTGGRVSRTVTSAEARSATARTPGAISLVGIE
jgi:hypothetical protein